MQREQASCLENSENSEDTTGRPARTTRQVLVNPRFMVFSDSIEVGEIVQSDVGHITLTEEWDIKKREEGEEEIESQLYRKGSFRFVYVAVTCGSDMCPVAFVLATTPSAPERAQGLCLIGNRSHSDNTNSFSPASAQTLR